MISIKRLLVVGLIGTLSLYTAGAQQPVDAVSIRSVTVLDGDGGVAAYLITDGGAGYNAGSPPSVTVVGGGGMGATATAELAQVVERITVTNGGSGYTSSPTVTISGSGGSGASAVAAIVNGQVTGVTVVSGGGGYTSTPLVEFSGGGGSGAIATAETTTKVARIEVQNAGVGYSAQPTVIIDAPPPGPGARTAVAIAYPGKIKAPNESFGPAGSTIYVEALAVGTFPVSGYTYEFFVDGISVGRTGPNPSNGTPAFLPWTPPRPGSYFLTVKATGNSGTATSLPVRFFATGTEIVNPIEGTLVPQGSSVVIQAVAMGAPREGAGQTDAFVKRIDFYADGVKVGYDSTYPYSIIYTPTGAGAARVIEARAFDSEDQQISPNGWDPATNTIHSVTPIGTPPRSVISSPSSGTPIPIGSSITVAVDASSSSGRITKVELYVDGELFDTKTTYPYSFDWSPSIVGTYDLVALTYDDKNNVVASTISTTPTNTPEPTEVVVAARPTITISSPANGTTVTGGSSITLTANATDGNTIDGVPATITSVQFFKNGKFIGSDNTATNGTTYSVAFTPLREVDESGNVIPTVITALATSSTGLTATSVGVTLNVTEGGSPPPPPVIGNPPSVAVTSPLASSQVPVNTSVSLAANAADTDGRITKVQFVVEDQVVVSDEIYPYTGSWTPTSLGTYRVTAIATDNDGNNVTSTVVTIQVVDASPGAPSVQVTSPISGAILTAGVSTTIQATASDDVAVASVQFFVNGVSLGTDTLQPYSSAWTPTSAGSYTIVARATDNAGTQTSSAPVVVTVGGGSAPSVSLTSPASDISITAGNNVTLAAIAADADGTVTSVRFLANGIPVATATSAPYLGTWKPTAAGAYSVVAEATDNAGNITTSSPRTVTVSGNSGPSVTITSPRAGAGVPVSSSTGITASASDPDGTIVSVTFYANNVSIGTDNTPPYSANWSPTAEGTYSLTAVAIDNSGNVVTSPAILVLAGTTGSEAIDTIASGIFIGGFDSGNFTAINVGNTSATFIGYVPATSLGAAKTYYFSDVPVIGSGQFELTNGEGVVVISGRFNDSGVTGTFVDGGTTYTFTGPVAFAQSGNAVRAGYYNGSLTNRLGSVLTGIVGLDGQITIYAKDGTFVDSGAGAIGANGAFSVTTKAGSKFTGTADPATGFLTGTVTKAGGAGTESFTGALSSGGTFSDGALFGLSTRAWVGTGSDILIAGLAVDGSVPKRLLIRGVGPSLGIANTVPNPQLKLYRGSNVIASNDNWGTPVGDGASGAEVAAAIQQAGLGTLGANDAAIVRTLNPGVYTTQLSDTGGATGNGLLEIYDLSTLTPFTAQKMVAISSRGYVGGAGSEMIAGFNVTGTFPKKILVQAVGPGMPGVSGALADPVLRIVKLNGTLVRENDNWDVGNDATMLARARAAAGATPLAAGSKDAAVLITLPPGIYTAVVSGAGGASGVGLVEVYEIK